MEIESEETSSEEEEEAVEPEDPIKKYKKSQLS